MARNNDLQIFSLKFSEVRFSVSDLLTDSLTIWVFLDERWGRPLDLKSMRVCVTHKEIHKFFQARTRSKRDPYPEQRTIGHRPVGSLTIRSHTIMATDFDQSSRPTRRPTQRTNTKGYTRSWLGYAKKNPLVAPTAKGLRSHRYPTGGGVIVTREGCGTRALPIG